MKRTKIVCTIGPASAKPALLRKMIRAGMNVARLNMSHGTYASHRAMIRMVRQAARSLHTTVGILVDLQGPKIRVGELPKEGVTLRAGSTVVFSTDPDDRAPHYLPVSYRKLHREVRPGERVLMDDGLMEAEIVRVGGRRITAKVVTGGVLTSHKGVNLPSSRVTLRSMTPKDYRDARFALAEGADWVALSFVRTASDVLDLRRAIGRRKDQPRIIVKIEKPEALKNFDAILAVTDGVMVARGDLGIEIPAEQVPPAQKMMVRKCLAAGKPVVVATQMLDSMIRNPRPTRAEVSDVANAVIDHADAVMLSGESATGRYPVEAVRVMARIAEETEASHLDDLPPSPMKEPETVRSAISGAAGLIAERVGAQAVVVATLSGDTARYIARTRPELPIFAATPSVRSAGAVSISWGVYPFVVPMVGTVARLIALMRAKLLKLKMVRRGRRLVLVAGKWRTAGEYVLQVVEA